MESIDDALLTKAQVGGGGGGGRSKLSLRRKKGKDPMEQSSPTRKLMESCTIQITPCDSQLKSKGLECAVTKSESEDISDKDPDTDTTVSAHVAAIGPARGRLVPLDGKGGDGFTDELARIGSPNNCRPDEGLGDYFFCHICQKDLTRFSESNREKHINRCCDNLEEEEKTLREAEQPVFLCLLCEKSLKTEKAHVAHMKSCAKSKEIGPDRLVQMLRESKERQSQSTVDSGRSSTQVEQEREVSHLHQTRKQKRSATKTKEGQQSLGSVSSVRDEDDFAMPPPSGPVTRRGRKRKRDNLQENYLEELEADQLQLALALSASMDPDTAPTASGMTTTVRQLTDTLQNKGRKKQRSGKKAVTQAAPPLLTVSAEQTQAIVSKRAEEILRQSEIDAAGTGEGDDCEIPCTPAFQESELGSCRPPSSHAAQTGAGINEQNRSSSDDLALRLGEDKIIELPELEDVVQSVAVDGDNGDDDATTCKVDYGSRTKNSDDSEPEPMHVDGITVATTIPEPQPAGDDEVHLSSVRGKEHSTASPRDRPTAAAAVTAATTCKEHTVSFHADLCDVDYPTLWELTSTDTDDIEDYYVPALASSVYPLKTDKYLLCNICKMEPCLAMTLLAHEPLSARQSSQSIDPPSTSTVAAVSGQNLQDSTSAKATVCQLLSDMAGLVGSSLLSDVEIHTQGGSVIPAHAVILAARSSVLRKVIEQSSSLPITLDFSEFDEESVKAFLQFIYTGFTPSSTNNQLSEKFALLLKKWYNDRSSGREGDESNKGPSTDRRDSLQRIVNASLVTTQLTDVEQSTLIYYERELEQASPKPKGESPLAESETLLLLDQASPIAEQEGDDPVIIETSPTSSGDDAVPMVERSSNSSKDLTKRVPANLIDHNVQSMESTDAPVCDPNCGTVKNRNSQRFSTDSLHIRVSNDGLICMEDSSQPLERDCSYVRLRSGDDDGSNEVASGQSSRESSHPNSHISLSSYNSSDLLVETPTEYMSPQGNQRERSASSCDLFPALENQNSINEESYCSGDSVREIEVEEGNRCPRMTDKHEGDDERGVESIVVESVSSRSLSITSVKSNEKLEKDSSNEELPVFSIPDYSPVGDYSFGAFEDDFCDPTATPEGITSPPAPQEIIGDLRSPPVDINHPSVPPEDISSDINHPHAFSEDIAYNSALPLDCTCSNKAMPLEERAPVELVTPVIERTVAKTRASIDTVKRRRDDFKTPAGCRAELQTDDDITPLPDFRSMRTPYLKGECARYGVKPMPKKKMIAKLHEIYEYTHPLVDEEGRVVAVDNSALEGEVSKKTGTKQRKKVAEKATKRTGKSKKAVPVEGAASSEHEAATQACDLRQKVLEYLKSDEQLYQDILLYKPLELSYFYTKLKTAGVSVTKERLADILDNLCVSFTIPRQQRSAKKPHE